MKKRKRKRKERMQEIFAEVAKLKKKNSQSPASEFDTKLQSNINFSSEF